MPTVDRGKNRLYWEWRGPEADTPPVPVLLLRGLSRTLRYWMGFGDRFAGKWRSLFMDNRGIGRSSDDGKRFDIETLADDTAAVLDAAGCEKANVFGISLGGMIAQQLAVRHPGRVNRLVLGATSPGPKHGKRISPSVIGKLVAANTLPRRLSGNVIANLTLYRLQGDERQAILDRWSELTRMEPSSRWAVFRQMFAALGHDTWDLLPRIEAPTLCLVGDRDGLIPAENTRLLADRIPGAEHVVLPGCGHDFPADDENESFRIVDEFFSKDMSLQKDNGPIP